MNNRDRHWAISESGSADWLLSSPSTYSAAGVNRVAGSDAVRRIRQLAHRTFDSRVLSDLGGSAGLFGLGASLAQDTVFVASTDGVGTKSLIASAMGRYNTIGRDLVAMNVDDIVVYGATPLFLLDFLVVEKVLPTQVEQIVSGVADGCVEAGCALLGGEVAEHPGTRAVGDFDLAGFVVGSVSSANLITGERIVPGDVVIGLSAQGMRSDGYSFVRKIFAGRSLDELAFPGAAHSLGDELLRPSKVYARTVLELINTVDVHGLAHVTGGGIAANVGRITPSTCDVFLKRKSWPIPRIFEEMRRSAGVSDEALESALPIGIGMVAVVDAESASTALECLAGAGQDAYIIGAVRPGNGHSSFVDAHR